jgi:ATP-dependent DNA helicase RecQ
LSTLSTTLFLDIETNGNQLLDVGAVWDTGELHERSTATLEAWIQKATLVCGHNLIAHDAPFLRKKLKSDVFTGKALVDTLFWSALMFPEKPYHKLVKGYHLVNDEVSNPLSDSKLCKQLLIEELGRFEELPQAMRDILHTLLHDKDGYGGFFHLAGYKSETTASAEHLVDSHFNGRLCLNADVAGLVADHPIALAHALALVETTESSSVLPAWVVHAYPMARLVLDRLRFAACGQSDCGYCSSRLDPFVGLQEFFEYDTFRTFDHEAGIGIQERAVRHALAGESLLTVFPTGGGKSLTFQLPALMQGELTRALTVVISPLVSLMKDQVDVLEERHHIVKAVHLSGLLSPLEREQVIERVEEGGVHLLYIAPETLRSPTLMKLLTGRTVARFVIDEAHCFSSWGQDFRVDYLYIAEFIKTLQQQKGDTTPIPVSCFTATAKPQVRDDICNYFRERLGLELEPFVSQARRENLAYEVVPVEDPKRKMAELLPLLQQCEKPAIIYASRTKRVEELVGLIRAAGFNVTGFHGKMDRDTKLKNQQDFMQGTVDIMVATSAFGMGVDKEDVRTVIHYNISSSLESYVQEAGRAGRKADIQAMCYVLYHEDDLSKHFQLLQRTKLNQKEIGEVWNAIKSLTKFREKVSQSALEIARRAGWDTEVRDLENRVTASLAALEDRGFLKRELNSPRLFANSLLVRDLNKAVAKVNESATLTEQQKQDCIRVLHRIVKEDECRVDYLADTLQLTTKKAQETVDLLRGLKILGDTKDLSAFMDLRPLSAFGSRKRLKAAISVERELARLLEEPEQQVSMRALNQHMLDVGIAETSPDILERILRYWDLRGHLKKKRVKRKEGVYRLRLRIEPAELVTEVQARHVVASAAQTHLEGLEAQGEPTKDPKEEVRVEFSLVGLQEALSASMFGVKTDLKELRGALLFMDRMGALKLEGGFMVTYKRLNITRTQPDGKKRFTKDDYQNLLTYYLNKIQQIHIVGEYAKKRASDYRSALAFVDDYFRMDYAAFIRKHFPKRGTEISRALTEGRFKQLFGELSTAQADIVKDDADHILVAAGPGSGKTRVLVHKIASLLLMEDVKPEQFLMLTFSKAAALEFRTRIFQLVPEYAGLIKVATFHGLCFELLGQLGDLEKSEKIIPGAIEAIQKEEVDVTALTNKSVLVLDEFQDVGVDQWALIRMIKEKVPGLRILAVGDDDQCIYGFAGASATYMDAFRETFQASTHQLLTNYRSAAGLVDLFNALAQRIQGRVKAGEVLIARSNEPGAAKLVEHADGHHLSALIEEVCTSPVIGSTAILTRTNNDALLAATMLRQNGVKARYVGGSDDFMLAALREIRLFGSMLGKQHAGIGLIPRSTWDRVRQAYLEKLENNPLRHDCADILTLFETRFPNQRDLAEWNGFIREIRMSDAIRPESGTVLVSTMHKAKGKEFDSVFVHLDNFPLYKDEEVRLLYVACTRAKSRLSIHANGPDLGRWGLPFTDTILDAVPRPMPERLECLLGLEDIFLDAQAKHQDVVRKLRTGDSLVPDETKVKADIAPGLRHSNSSHVVIYSTGFAHGPLARFKRMGYSVAGGSVEYLVNWFCAKDGKTYEVVLPRISLLRS